MGGHSIHDSCFVVFFYLKGFLLYIPFAFDLFHYMSFLYSSCLLPIHLIAVKTGMEDEKYAALCSPLKEQTSLIWTHGTAESSKESTWDVYLTRSKGRRNQTV
ncbi:hypothetical protein BDW74DRAFT_138892 [Aspergillus multicolor]|uniref:uncharacterized protein n=1 Tax=Aspergillus multicolor TaxID=41759 RepID=UPI003CCC922B